MLERWRECETFEKGAVVLGILLVIPVLIYAMSKALQVLFGDN